jgi:histidine triad (HIT) family protein
MSDCLFCKIVKGDIPSTKVFENDSVIGFVDIFPQAKTHLLFIHKKHTADINQMSSDPESIGQVFQAITSFTKEQGLDQKGFRVVTNTGKHAGQTVFHTHFHVLAGEQLGHFGR